MSSMIKNILDSTEIVSENCLNTFFNTANTGFDYKTFFCINDDLFPVLLVNYGNFNGRRLVLFNNGCILKISGHYKDIFIHETFEQNYSELSYDNKKRLDFIKSNGKGVITQDIIKLIYIMFGFHEKTYINPCDYCEKIVNICNSKTIYTDYIEEIKRNIYKETGRFCTNPKQTKIVQNGTDSRYINVHSNLTCGMDKSSFRNMVYINGKYYRGIIQIENERDLYMFEKLINGTLSMRKEKHNNLERHKIDIKRERDEFEAYKKLEKEKIEKHTRLNENDLSFKIFITFLLVVILTKLFQV